MIIIKVCFKLMQFRVVTLLFALAATITHANAQMTSSDYFEIHSRGLCLFVKNCALSTYDFRLKSAIESGRSPFAKKLNKSFESAKKINANISKSLAEAKTKADLEQIADRISKIDEGMVFSSELEKSVWSRLKESLTYRAIAHSDGSASTVREIVAKTGVNWSQFRIENATTSPQINQIRNELKSTLDNYRPSAGNPYKGHNAQADGPTLSYGTRPRFGEAELLGWDYSADPRGYAMGEKTKLMNSGGYTKRPRFNQDGFSSPAMLAGVSALGALGVAGAQTVMRDRILNDCKKKYEFTNYDINSLLKIGTIETALLESAGCDDLQIDPILLDEYRTSNKPSEKLERFFKTRLEALRKLQEPKFDYDFGDSACDRFDLTKDGKRISTFTRKAGKIGSYTVTSKSDSGAAVRYSYDLVDGEIKLNLSSAECLNKNESNDGPCTARLQSRISGMKTGYGLDGIESVFNQMRTSESFSKRFCADQSNETQLLCTIGSTYNQSLTAIPFITKACSKPKSDPKDIKSDAQSARVSK